MGNRHLSPIDEGRRGGGSVVLWSSNCDGRRHIWESNVRGDEEGGVRRLELVAVACRQLCRSKLLEKKPRHCSLDPTAWCTRPSSRPSRAHLDLDMQWPLILQAITDRRLDYGHARGLHHRRRADRDMLLCTENRLHAFARSTSFSTSPRSISPAPPRHRSPREERRRGRR